MLDDANIFYDTRGLTHESHAFKLYPAVSSVVNLLIS